MKIEEIILLCVNAFEEHLADEYVLLLRIFESTDNSPVLKNYLFGNTDRYTVSEKLSKRALIRGSDSGMLPLELDNSTYKRYISLAEKVKLILVSKEFIYDIIFSKKNENLKVVVHLTSAILGKSTYYNYYNLVETGNSCQFKIHTCHNRTKYLDGFEGNLIECIVKINDIENSDHPYEEYKCLYPKNWCSQTAVDRLCEKAFWSNL